jgi:putative Mg2+ transporter-C (MgtC) family protein
MNWEIFLRLLLAGIFGAVIGFERTSKRKEAGIRTHFLVALGSALIMIVSKYGFNDIIGNHIALDPSRIAAQVVSGIGFIGAGMIIFQRETVRGLTTAAGLWATAGIGLAVGAGMYWISLSVTILVFSCLEFLHISIAAFTVKHLKLTIGLTEKEGVQEVIKIIAQKNIHINTLEYRECADPEHPGEPEFVLEFDLELSPRGDTFQLLNAFQNISGVNSVRFD